MVAIIAILAAMLLPVLSQAKEKANATVCMNSEKQIGLAILLFHDDNDETIPPMSDATYHAQPSRFDFARHAKGTAPYNWADWLIDEGYMEFNAFDCPTIDRSRVGSAYFDEEASDTHADYLYNGFLYDNVGDLPGRHGVDPEKPLPMRLIIRPAEGMLLMDGHGPGWNPVGIRPWMGHCYEHASGTSGEPGQDGRLRHMHRQGMNLLFFDWHVEARNLHQELFFDSPFYAARFGVTDYTPYSNGQDPTPIWRPWHNTSTPFPWE